VQHDLAGWVALVVGGASGIGEACARALSMAGADVVVADLAVNGAQQIADGLVDRPGRAVAAQVDVTDPASVDALGAMISDDFGRLDLAVNSAGIGSTNQPVSHHDAQAWRRTIAANLEGTFLSMRMELGLMQQTGGGAVVNIASILAHRGLAGASAYVAAKHGVIGLTRSAALECAESGIRVNSVSPGFIETPLLVKRNDDAARARLGASHPVSRLGLPDEVANVVLWLLCGSASFITGADYAVDGGFLAK
jgi:NAD(P)-dependent dehydrogenase (short-subunit alcohol dehydrogenase family)